MSEFEPIDLKRDSNRLINELTEIGLVAGKYLSRAALEYGDDHPITQAFDDIAQNISGSLLRFRLALRDIDLEASVQDMPDGKVPPLSTFRSVGE